jgi:hypothetical protein
MAMRFKGVVVERLSAKRLKGVVVERLSTNKCREEWTLSFDHGAVMTGH